MTVWWCVLGVMVDLPPMRWRLILFIVAEDRWNDK